MNGQREFNCTLHRYHHPALPIDAAVRVLAGAVGYLYAPGGFVVARASEGGIELPPQRTVFALDQVYEARLATAVAELRWLRDPADAGGRGRAALLSEVEQEVLPDGWAALDVLGALQALDTPLLTTALAAAHEHETGWLAVNAPRHGLLHLPWPGSTPAPQARLAWRWREYLGPAAGEAGEDGNCSVVAARLAGLQVATNSRSVTA